MTFYDFSVFCMVVNPDREILPLNSVALQLGPSPDRLKRNLENDTDQRTLFRPFVTVGLFFSCFCTNCVSFFYLNQIYVS